MSEKNWRLHDGSRGTFAEHLADDAKYNLRRFALWLMAASSAVGLLVLAEYIYYGHL
ncbi:MAG: hypothetical protein KGI47_11610 [Betaproteobacteria bacterium]|nr:hypothetical protein [Betaproteobacteria bacterium]